MVKSLSILHETEITHVFDRESKEGKHIKQFRNTLDAMKGAEEEGKAIKYQLGYTNFTFELWIILHKADCTFDAIFFLHKPNNFSLISVYRNFLVCVFTEQEGGVANFK